MCIRVYVMCPSWCNMCQVIQSYKFQSFLKHSWNSGWINKTCDSKEIDPLAKNISIASFWLNVYRQSKRKYRLRKLSGSSFHPSRIKFKLMKHKNASACLKCIYLTSYYSTFYFLHLCVVKYMYCFSSSVKYSIFNYLYLFFLRLFLAHKICFILFYKTTILCLCRLVK